MTKKKIIVIGGGPSGMMSALSCSSNPQNSVTILEKKSKLGTKLLISGGGRCNVTNSGNIEHIVNNVIGNGKFLYSALNQFSPVDIINFFENNGCSLKQENHGRMFPKSNRSLDILKTIQNQLNKNNVEIKTSCAIKKVIIEEDKLVAVMDQQNNLHYADHFVFALGGKSYPEVGTTGDGYAMLSKLGHTITKLYPCEVPLVSKDEIIKNSELMGLSFPNIEISIINAKNKKLVTINNDILFTHFGLSGPGALRCSSFVYKELQKNSFTTAAINFFPNLSKDELTSKILHLINEHEDKLALNVMSLLLNKKVMKIIFEKNEMNLNLKAKEIKRYLNVLVEFITSFKIKINTTLGFDKAFVTGGGVKIKEINPKTLKSKLHNNVSICGEIIDINAYTGGYNITAALSTGYVSGKHI